MSGDSPNGSPASTAFQPRTSSPSLSSRQPPVTALAPLELLQNQRRGSITDPSLHAAPTPPAFSSSTAAQPAISSPFRRPDSPATSFSSSAPHERGRSFSQTRPLSPYKFGDASAQPGESPNAHLRRLLRSPSVEMGDRRTPTQAPGLDSGREGNTRGGVERNGNADRAKGSDKMDVDRSENAHPQGREPGGNTRPEHAVRDMEDVDYNGRRQSVVAGTKRKMSSDKGVYPPGPTDIDPQLVGTEGREPEEPAPKRRGSAIDTQRIAQLSLYDRRNSVDARAAAGSPWWTSDRRDSTSSASAFTNTNTNTNANTPLTTGFSTPSSAIPGDSPHGRPPGGIATFAWPAQGTANPHAPPDQAAPPAMQNEPAANMQGPPHPFDPLAQVMPPVAFAPDRRMSAPNISAENLPPPPSSGPTRALRSRSRPPSRVRTIDQSAPNDPGQASPGSSVNPEDAASSSRLSDNKPPGSTPYSRSPELRISHKLAERKRRKEMKELFDELRDQLPADRGMKASKWEILSKAIDFIVTLKQSHQDMGREIEMLRHELEGYRQGMPPPFPGAPPHAVVYGHGPPVGVPPYPPPPHGAPGVPPHQQPPPHTQPAGPPGAPGHPVPPHHSHPMSSQMPQQQPLSRPGSSQNAYPPGGAPPQQQPQQQLPQPPTVNGNGPTAATASRTDTPT
ncbi:hypothetical protein BD413DRAFT_491212 [Trametes elegans]|nr:hypothetical protein BD413DRAFT_491212 [Trametes elegans]